MDRSVYGDPYIHYFVTSSAPDVAGTKEPGLSSSPPSAESSELDLTAESPPAPPHVLGLIPDGVQRIEEWVEQIDENDGEWQDAAQATAGGRSKVKKGTLLPHRTWCCRTV